MDNGQNGIKMLKMAKHCKKPSRFQNPILHVTVLALLALF
jgi:hypothetical protein